MNRWMRFLGLAGVVLLLFGIIGAFMIGDFTHPMMLGHIVVGGACVLCGLLSSGLGGGANVRKVISYRGATFGANALIYVGVFAGVLIGLNWIANNHNQRWDLTSEGVFSLSEQTEKILAALDKPLKIVAFTKNTGVNDKDNDRIKLYAQASKNVSVDIVNPSSKPQLVEKYQMTTGNLVYIQYGDDKNIIGQVRLDNISEEAITNGIIKLTKGAAKKIYYVSGHGEPDMGGDGGGDTKFLIQAMKDEHLTVEEILLGQKGEIPKDVAAVMLVSPKKAMLPEEKKLLIDYVKGGGHLLMLGDPMYNGDVREISKEFGIDVGNDVVVDQVQRLFAAPALGAQPVVLDYGRHQITQGMGAKSISIYNIASSVYPSATDKRDSSAVYTELVKTSKTSWAETDLDSLFSESPTADRSDVDRAGPITLATVYEKTLSAPSSSDASSSGGDKQADKKVSRVVVFGDSDFALNANVNVYSNRDLILNSISWVAGEEANISIRPKSFKLSIAPIPQSTFLLLLSLSFLIPEIILILGLVVWWRRRTVVA